MKPRKCNCQKKSCKYCKERNRYEKEHIKKKEKKRAIELVIKLLREERQKLIDSMSEKELIEWCSG